MYRNAIVLFLCVISIIATNRAEPNFKGVVEDVTIKNQIRKVVAFKGIRYVKKPDRFKHSELLEPSDEQVIEATEFGPPCPQPDPTVGNTNEDCLFLNVYVPHRVKQAPAQKKAEGPHPKEPQAAEPPVDGDQPNSNLTTTEMDFSTKLPVYVFIHGGAYSFGFGHQRNPSGLVAFGEVIVVTFNYRLGVLGLLTTGTDHMPTNLALGDQQKAIQWVKKCVSVFGGNPDKITLGGQSSGSYSTILQALNPENDHLFQGVIAQSGTPLSPFSLASKEEGAAVTSAFAKYFKCSEISDAKKVKECLSQVPAIALVYASLKIPWLKPLNINLRPVHEEHFTTILKSDVDEHFFKEKNLLIGYDSHDGDVMLRFYLRETITAEHPDVSIISEEYAKLYKTSPDIEELNKIVYEVRDGSLPQPENLPLDVQTIVDRYANWEHPEDQTLSAIELMTDYLFAKPVVETALRHISNGPASSTAPGSDRRRRGAASEATAARATSAHGKTFFYVFKLPTELQTPVNKWQRPDHPAILGTPHSAEMPYFFGTDKINDTQKGDLSMKCIEFLANFIKTGIPGLTEGATSNGKPTVRNFEQFSDENRKYIEISSDIEQKTNPAAGALHFWDVQLKAVVQVEADLRKELSRPTPAGPNLREELSTPTTRATSVESTTDSAPSQFGGRSSWFFFISISCYYLCMFLFRS